MRFKGFWIFLVSFALTMNSWGQRFASDKVYIGRKATVLDKVLEFDTGDGGSNAKMSVDNATQNFTLSKSTKVQGDLTLGSGSPASRQISVDRGADNPYLKWDETAASWVFSNNGATTQRFGSGGGGALNLYPNSGDAESLAVSDFGTGNNATFGTAGSFGGTLALSTTSTELIRGTRVLKYTQGASSLNDWVASDPINVDQGYRGRFLGFKFEYKYNGADNDLEVEAKCTTNGAILTGSGAYAMLLRAQNSANNVSKTFSGSFFVPETCTQVEVGISVAVLNNGKILILDELVLTPDPFVYKNLDNDIGWQSFPQTGTWVTNTTYDAKWRKVGQNMEMVGKISLAGAPTATALYVNIPSGFVIDTANIPGMPGIGTIGDAFIWDQSNYPTYNAGVGVYTTTQLRFDVNNVASAGVTSTFPVTFAVNDFIYWKASVPIVGWSEQAENIISYSSKEAADSYIKAYSSNGYGSTNTTIRKFSLSETSQGSAITYTSSATLGDSVTLNEAGSYSITYCDTFTAAAHFGLSKNSAQLTTAINSITVTDRLAMATTPAGGQTTCTSFSGPLNRGDIIRPHADATADSAVQGRSVLIVTKQGTKSLVGIPTSYVVTPPGSVVQYVGATAPDGWLVCDGSNVSRTLYPQLFGVIGTKFGNGDGSTTFTLPDMRGKFARGWANGSANDPNRTTRTAQATGGNTGDLIGSVQPDELESHGHSFLSQQVTISETGGGRYVFGGASGNSVNNTGGSETRPINVYFNYIIKY